MSIVPGETGGFNPNMAKTNRKPAIWYTVLSYFTEINVKVYDLCYDLKQFVEMEEDSEKSNQKNRGRKRRWRRRKGKRR